MYCNTSSAAAGWTTSSSEPARKIVACRTAKRRGLTASSGGMSGKTAAPSGTSDSPAALMSASGHGGDDRQLVAVLDRRGEIIEIANVLIVEEDVDEAADLAVVEDALGQGGVFRPQRVQRRLHGGPVDLHGRLPLGVLPHRRRDV